jgi:ribosomal protein S12 methylthiotransferase
MLQESPSKVRIVTLGCAKNEVDSEEIAGVLKNAGYELDGNAKKTALTIINTCGFLESAKEESVKVIKEAVREKRAGRTGKVIVAGCLAQRLGPELKRLAPGADLYIGVGQMARFAEIALEVQQARDSQVEIEVPHHRWADVQTRARAGRPWSAYLKISEGCDHKCTFCTIPSFRGGHQSKPIERVLAEARHLANTGAVEINLIAQDVTQYGYDLYKEFTLPKLLRGLNAIDGIRWIRLLYFYPNRLTDEVIETMATCDKVLPYIDIPLQHTHPDVLRRMHRPWDGDRYLNLFEKVRAAMPDCAIRTTFIVGFPGESEDEFNHLLTFCREAKLDRVGAFQFSREPSTPSFDLAGQVPSRIKNERYDKLMRTQQSISLEKNEAWIGKTLEVLIEDNRQGWLIGRSHRDAPEIDGLVFVSGEATPGSIVHATINGAEHYDLYAEMGNSPQVKARKLTSLRLATPLAPK